jgi:branched-chain amino acid transport system permease protein
MKLLLQLLANGVVTGVLFALLAVGFGLVYRSVRVFHIAFAALLVVACYGFLLAVTWGRLPIWLGMLVGVAVAGLSGWGIERGLYRPFFVRKAGSGVVMVASLGVLVVVENLFAITFGDETRAIPRQLASLVEIGPVQLTSIQVLQVAVGGAVLSGFALATRHVLLFKAIWAMGDQPDLVPVLGMPLMRYRTAVFVLSAVLGALPGCLIALDVGMNPHMGMSYLLVAAVAVLAGGLDRYKGWIVGGFVLAILQSLVVWKMSAKWMDLATFGVLLLVLMFRPQGILGIRKRLEETTA